MLDTWAFCLIYLAKGGHSDAMDHEQSAQFTLTDVLIFRSEAAWGQRGFTVPTSGDSRSPDGRADWPTRLIKC